MLADAPKRDGKQQGASVRMDLPIRNKDEEGVTIPDEDTSIEAHAPEAAE
jgi:hypothetical protein